MPLTQAEIDAKLRQPESATTDAGSATNRSADDLIKLDQYAAAKEAAAADRPPFTFRKLVPPGSV